MNDAATLDMSTAESTFGRQIRSKIVPSIRNTLQNPNHYIKALRSSGWALAKGPSAWANRLTGMLEDVEKFAFWNFEEWSRLNDVDQARREFFGTLRSAIGPRLKDISNPDLRRKWNRFLFRIESHLQVSDPFCRPSRAKIEFTDVCNLKCVMCPHAYWEWKKTYADESVIRRAESLYPWLMHLDLEGLGESLIAPQFRKALPRIPDHIFTTLVTNGVLVDDKMAEFLVAHNLKDLNVSIDAATPETYLQIRAADHFETIIQNCRRLVAAKKATGNYFPILTFNFVMFKRNLHELIPLIRTAADLGFQRVHANPLSVWFAVNREDSIYWCLDQVRDTLAEGSQVARDLGVELLHHWPMQPPAEVPPKPESDCKQLWDFMYFRANGRLNPCCYGVEEYRVDRETGWEEVWDGPAYRRLRTQINLSGDEAPPMCRSCDIGRNISPLESRFHFKYELLDEHQTTGRIRDPLADVPLESE